MTMAKKPSKPVKKSPPKAKSRSASTQKPAGRSKPATASARKTASGGKASVGKSGARTAKRPAKKVVLARKPAVKKAVAKPRAGSPKKQVEQSSKVIRTTTHASKTSRAPVSKATGKTPAKPSPKALTKVTAKSEPKATNRPDKSAAAAPAVKPSAGEIAARLSAKRTEKALAEGKMKGGKNGVDMRKVELSPADVEARRARLKNLIVLGKERSYLTYAEINDHLPDDIVDAEQIEGIISMINDMGIQVYDEAPDAEQLLMSEATPAVAAEDVDEEAEAAASTLDSEFGRTTDPVRMYMREMGSVELLTREGEIEIAKRIEEGLKHMIMAISACPMTVQQILDLAAKIEKDEIKIDDLVDGLMDFTERVETIEVDNSGEEIEEDEEDSGAIAAENLERLKVAALARFAVIRRLYARMLVILQKEGHKAPKYLELQKKISAELMMIRFSARQVERLCDTVRC